MDKVMSMSDHVNDIAQWMFNELKSAGILYQSVAIQHILDNYGEAHIYVTESGNRSISKDVKKAFKKLHQGRAAWERDGFFWGWV
jgi:hypothetical protein